MEPCDCDECMGIGHFAEVEKTVVEEQVSYDELSDFKRYTELLEKVYSTKTTATAEEQEELTHLGYKLALDGVSDAISEMNFNRLQEQLELENDILNLDVFEYALEIRIRDIKTKKIESWYCQRFDSKKDYDKEVDKQFDLKNYYKKTHLFEIEHLNIQHFVHVKRKFQFKHKDSNLIYNCKVHLDGTCETTWTDKGIFHSSLCGFDHLKISIRYGDWIVVE
jgi:hypothetical protein